MVARHGSPLLRAAAAVVALIVLVPVPLAVGASSQASASSPGPNPLCSTQPCAPLISGWVHTEPGATSVYDSDGTVVPLLGVDVDGLDFGTGNPASSPDSCGEGYGVPPGSFTDVASWGFNSIRVPISWSNLEPTAPTLASNGTWIHHWNTAYLDELDTVVSEFGQAHIPLILDFAQVDVSPAFQQAPEKVQGGECEGWGNPIWLYPSITSPTTTDELSSALCSFFNDQSLVGNSAPSPIEAMEAAETMLASRYATNPEVIGIDMFNEPWFGSSCGSVKSEGDLLTSFYTKMGNAIEAVNPHLLVVFEEPPPGLMPQSPIMASPPVVSNAMYSFHIYTANWTAAQPYMAAYLSNAKAWGVPMWMGEFNDFEAGCTGPNCASIVDPNWQADSNALLAYCAANGVNWAFFSYYSLGTSVATPVPKAEIIAQLRSSLPVTLAASSTTSTATTSTTMPTASSTTTTAAPTLSSTTSSTLSTTTETSTAAPPTTTSTVPEFNASALAVTLLASMVVVGLLAGHRPGAGSRCRGLGRPPALHNGKDRA